MSEYRNTDDDSMDVEDFVEGTEVEEAFDRMLNNYYLMEKRIDRLETENSILRRAIRIVSVDPKQESNPD